MKKLYTSTDDIQGDKSIRIVSFLLFILIAINHTRDTFFSFAVLVRFFKDSNNSIMADVIARRLVQN